MDKRFYLASEADLADVLALYRSQIGREFCPWDEHYPSEENIRLDLSLDSLFVMRDGDGVLMAAVSLDHDEAADALECWDPQLRPAGELARIAVNVDLQNRGIAREIIGYVMDVLRQRGFRSVRMLVNKNNKKALASYAKLGFSTVGECFMFEQPFWCYEKEL